jgi:tetratricopeptide (TPR) repeat protein
VDPSAVSAGAFSVGAGALYDPVEWATLGFSVEDLNRPNLGVIGSETLPPLFRYGVAVKPHVGEDRLLLTLSQSLSEASLATQGGAEWSFTAWGTALRIGGDANNGVVGLGWRSSGLAIDYAYQFSWNEAPSLGGVGLPGSHLLEISFNWENSSREKKVYDGLLYKGNEAMKAKRWNDAFWCFQQAYLLRPNEPAVTLTRDQALKQYNLQRAEAYFKEGRKAEDQGYFPEARRDYEWAALLGPQEKVYADARDRVKKAITQGALSDPRVQKLLERSVAMIKEGSKRSAFEKIKEAQALYPRDAFLEFMAKAFSLKAYAELSPMDVKMDRMAVEAEIYRSKGRLDLAKETWGQMLKLDPKNGMARENLAESEKTGPAGSLSPEDRVRSQALLQKGLKAYVNGDTESAVRYWEAVLKVDPQNVNALNNLTRVKMDEGGSPK